MKNPSGSRTGSHNEVIDVLAVAVLALIAEPKEPPGNRQASRTVRSVHTTTSLPSGSGANERGDPR